MQCSQGRKHNAGKETNTASAGPSEANGLRNDTRYGNEATGKDDDHDNNATVASLRGWEQCQSYEGKEARATLVTTPVQRRHQQCNACKDASATRAMMPVQRQQNHQHKIGWT
jgi:hypothetical protein